MGTVVQLAAYRPQKSTASTAAPSGSGSQPRLDRQALERSCQAFVAGLQRMRLAKGMLAGTGVAATDPTASP